MGQHAARVAKLTFDPGVAYLASVADQQEEMLATIDRRLTALEAKVAACCGPTPLAPAPPAPLAPSSDVDRIAEGKPSADP